VRQACSEGGEWDPTNQEPLEERRGGMRPVHQVGGRAHGGYRAQTGNNSVIKSGDIICQMDPFLQTLMFEPESIQSSSETIILFLKPSQIFLVCMFKLMGACCSRKGGDTVLTVTFVFQRASGYISVLSEEAVTPAVLHYPQNALCWQSERQEGRKTDK